MTMTKLERQLLKAAAGTISRTDPLAVTMNEALRLSGFSRSEIYRRATRGTLILLKCNNRTLVDYASLKANIADLPRADVHIADA